VQLEAKKQAATTSSTIPRDHAMLAATASHDMPNCIIDSWSWV
jgi:hypothetical protein